MMAPELIIAIPSFRRPRQLRQLLGAIAMLTTSRAIGIVVADNDMEQQQGVAEVRRLQQTGYRFPIHAVVVERRGLASVRNALMAEALKETSVQYVALIDDDEWPDPGWIEALVAMQMATGADVVGGPVRTRFASPVPASVDACRLFRPNDAPDGDIGIVWGTNNVLLTRRCLAQIKSDWFDQAYELSGGEDVDFFVRQKMAGCRFAWARNAIVWEEVPAARSRYDWILRRAFRIGNTNALIQTRWRFRGRNAAGVLIVGVAKLLLATLGLPIRAIQTAQRANACYDVAEAAGMVLGAVGFRYYEYAK
jgi:glycosyltransferase involved in cell wall biosynthesis